VDTLPGPTGPWGGAAEQPPQPGPPSGAPGATRRRNRARYFPIGRRLI